MTINTLTREQCADYQQADWEAWCPGAEVGKPVAKDINPLVFSGQLTNL